MSGLDLTTIEAIETSLLSGAVLSRSLCLDLIETVRGYQRMNDELAARLERIQAACAMSDEEAKHYVASSSACTTDFRAFVLGRVLQRVMEAAGHGPFDVEAKADHRARAFEMVEAELRASGLVKMARRDVASIGPCRIRPDDGYRRDAGWSCEGEYPENSSSRPCVRGETLLQVVDALKAGTNV